MLNLLSTTDAAFIFYCATAQNDWQLAFDPINKQNIHNDEKARNQLWMHQTFVENAIKAGELPVMQMPKGSQQIKRFLDNLVFQARHMML